MNQNQRERFQKWLPDADVETLTDVVHFHFTTENEVWVLMGLGENDGYFGIVTDFTTTEKVETETFDNPTDATKWALIRIGEIIDARKEWQL